MELLRITLPVAHLFIEKIETKESLIIDRNSIEWIKKD
jgi:hypothetical protein